MSQTTPTESTSARAASVLTLAKFDQELRIDHALMDTVEGQNRQQVNEYVQGILRRKTYLDFLIAQFSSIPFDDITPVLRNVLRVGIYDLLFMDGTPDYAAVNEAVELAKNLVSPKTGDFANAILRKIQRDVAALPKPTGSTRAELVATTFSHPQWLVERWVKRYGEREAFAIMQANNKRPEYFLRVNNLKTQTENFILRLEKAGVEFEDDRRLPGYFRVKTLGEVRSKGWFEKGICQVQDIAAGFAPYLLNPKPGETVYDICAAPGTKTIVMAELMKNEGSITAIDQDGERIGLIAQNAEAYKADIVKVMRADARDLNLKLADAVLLDAPCTGTGVMGKRADLRWRRNPQDLENIVKLQAELLDAAANLVNKNGRLVYSTCSLEPEENMEQIEKFLQEYPNFELADLSGLLPDEILAEDKKSYQTMPHKHNCDGHFGVLLVRKQ
jgi:16S rRNA (cytosine967-C5)-methyltransferase